MLYISNHFNALGNDIWPTNRYSHKKCFLKIFASFRGLGPGFRPFLISQLTDITQKLITMSF